MHEGNFNDVQVVVWVDLKRVYRYGIQLTGQSILLHNAGDGVQVAASRLCEDAGRRVYEKLRQLGVGAVERWEIFYRLRDALANLK